MKNFTSFLILLCLTFEITYAQKSNHGVYLELGGNGILASANIETSILKNPQIRSHIGIGMYGFMQRKLTIPLGINYLLPIRNTKSYLDIGLGMTFSKANMKLYVNVDDKNSIRKPQNFSFVPNLSYRTHVKNRMLLRIGFTPVITQYLFIPHFGIAVGKLF